MKMPPLIRTLNIVPRVSAIDVCISHGTKELADMEIPLHSADVSVH